MSLRILHILDHAFPYLSRNAWCTLEILGEQRARLANGTRGTSHTGLPRPGSKVCADRSNQDVRPNKALVTRRPGRSDGTELACTDFGATSDRFCRAHAPTPCAAIDGRGATVSLTGHRSARHPICANARPHVRRRLSRRSIARDWSPSLETAAIPLCSACIGGTRVRHYCGRAIKPDWQDSYRRIVDKSEGFYAVFARFFFALTIAAGIPVRACAFAFNGFGVSQGWVVIWHRQLVCEQHLDIFDHYCRPSPNGFPISARAFRRAILANPVLPQPALLRPEGRSCTKNEARMHGYPLRVLGEWWMISGSNLFSLGSACLVCVSGSISRSLKQLGGNPAGVYSGIGILVEPANRKPVEKVRRLRDTLLILDISGVAASLLLVALAAWWRAMWLDVSRL